MKDCQQCAQRWWWCWRQLSNLQHPPSRQEQPLALVAQVPRPERQKVHYILLLWFYFDFFILNLVGATQFLKPTLTLFKFLLKGQKDRCHLICSMVKLSSLQFYNFEWFLFSTMLFWHTFEGFVQYDFLSTQFWGICLVQFMLTQYRGSVAFTWTSNSLSLAPFLPENTINPPTWTRERSEPQTLRSLPHWGHIKIKIRRRNLQKLGQFQQTVPQWGQAQQWRDQPLRPSQEPHYPRWRSRGLSEKIQHHKKFYLKELVPDVSSPLQKSNVKVCMLWQNKYLTFLHRSNLKLVKLPSNIL